MNRLKNILLFVLPIAFIGLVCLYFFQRQQFRQVTYQQKIQTYQDSMKMGQFYNYVLAYGNYISVPLNKSMSVTDSSNHIFSIKELIKNRTFIFHFDETNCFTCVEKYLPYLKKLSNRIGKKNVIILGSYERSENLFYTLSDHELEGIAVYNLAPHYLRGTQIGELNNPYIFEVDSMLHTKHFFVPEKAFPGLSEVYNSVVLK